MVIFYVSPNGKGIHGTFHNPASIADINGFWLHTVKPALNSSNVIVQLLPGEYSFANLHLRNINPSGSNQLIIQGEKSYESRILVKNTGPSPDCCNPSNTLDFIRLDSINRLTIRNIHFTGNGCFGRMISIRLRSKNIRFENCTFKHMRKIKIAVIEVEHSQHITIEDCEFENCGIGVHAHFIYCVNKETKFVNVIRCQFKDCTGDHVRFRGGVEPGVVSGCTFENTLPLKETLSYKNCTPINPPRPYQIGFISVPAFTDYNNTFEPFGTNYTFINNTFHSRSSESNVPHAIWFHHNGYVPIIEFLLNRDPKNWKNLEEGTKETQRNILRFYLKIIGKNIRMYGSTVKGRERLMVYSAWDYDSVGERWAPKYGPVDIHKIVNYDPILDSPISMIF